MGLHRVGHDWRDLAAAAAAEALKIQQAKEILVAQAKGNFPKSLHQNFPVSPSEIIKELIDSKFQLLIKKLIWSPYYPLVILTMQKAIATHSSTLAWKIPWTEEPGRLQSMGSLGVGHDWVTSLSLSTFMHWRRKWQLTPVFLPRESHGWRSLVGCSPWGCTELDTTEVT